MLKKKLIDKLQASGIHLGISAVIFIALLFFILYYWYPFPFFYTDGGWEGVRIMILVDLVLGPALTLIIYSKEKTRKQIIFDLTSIGLVQLIAMIWGGFIVHQERPAVVVIKDGTAASLREARFVDRGIDLDFLAELSSSRPPIVYSISDNSLEELFEKRKRMQEGIHEMEHIGSYRNLPENIKDAVAGTLSLKRVAKFDALVASSIDTFLKEQGGTADDYYIIPYTGKYKQGWLILDKKGRVRDIFYYQS